jgi:tetratricopeptide (TPR) repeat protein
VWAKKQCTAISQNQTPEDMSKKTAKQQAQAPQTAPTLQASKAPTATGQSWLFPAIVFFFAFLLYANTLRHGYTQDDAIVITENMFTQQGIKGIPGILKYDTFYGFFKEEGKAALVSGGRYRPLTLVMFAIEKQIFGNSSFAYHFFGLLYYGLLAVVVYWCLAKLLHPMFDKRYASIVAFGAALLFVAHPLHTEVVANIKGRDETIALLCSMAALLFSLKSYDEGKPKYLWAAGALAFLGLMSKEYPAVLVALVPITFWVFRKASTNAVVKQALPYLAALVLFVLVRTAALGWQFGGEPPKELMNNPFLQWTGSQYVPFTGGEKMATIFYTLGRYLVLLVFPHPLTHDYYPLQIPKMTFANWQAFLPLLTYLALGVWATYGIKKRNVFAYCAAFYLLTLALVSNLLFPIGTNMAERFMFIPSLGFCLALALLLAKYFIKNNDNKNNTNSNFSIFFIGISIICLAYAAKTFARNPVWKDNYTLFTTDVKTSPNSAKLQNAVGGETIAQALEKPEGEERNAMLESAIPHLQEALRLHPTYKNAYLLMGNAYYYLKRYDEAENAYNNALSLDADYRDAKNNRSLVYEEKGKIIGGNGDHASAIQYFQKALETQPDNAKLWFFLGATYGMANQPQQAIESLWKALDKSPGQENHARIYENLSLAYGQLGDAAKAAEYKQKAQEYSPPTSNGQ